MSPTVNVMTLLVLQTVKYVFPQLQSAESLMVLLSRMAKANQIKNLMGHFTMKMVFLIFSSQGAKSSLQQTHKQLWTAMPAFTRFKLMRYFFPHIYVLYLTCISIDIVYFERCRPTQDVFCI